MRILLLLLAIIALLAPTAVHAVEANSVTVSALRGDADGNGSVDVSDVNAIINVMLGKRTVDDYSGNCDINNNGEVDVADLNCVVNIIMNPSPAGNRICLAYAPYYRSRLPRADLVTHINFAFAEVYVRNNVYQGFKLQGDNNLTAFKKVLALREQNPDIQILLSFSHTVVNGDNKQDGGFSAIAASETNRKKFAEDCVAFMVKWNIDGIDLDWEMPGLSWSGAACDTENDTDNFTLLVKQMRETFGSKYLITFAGYVKDKRRQSSGTGWKFFDLKAVKPYIDWVNIMTYDLDDASSGHRGFHNGVKSSTSYWDIERTMAEYTAAGYDSTQIVIGIPFYLRHSFDESPSAIDYCNFYRYPESIGYNYNNWDEDAMCPYVTLNGTFYGSYDNVVSIAAKGEKYIGGGRVRGLMYWDAGADDIDYTLASACWKAVTKRYNTK